MLRAGLLGDLGLILWKYDRFSLLQFRSGAHQVPYPIGIVVPFLWGESGRSVRLASDLHQISPVLLTSSWCDS
jgi:hypothetical protein